VRIGDGAYTATGSVITKDVSPDALAIARGRQSEIAEWAKAFREKKRAAKAAKKP
jgi:bifunctional UDP-N-acetylglucosamine pyrophosphorylase/glucosamine-1-phosphate N-acetyltransferase